MGKKKTASTKKNLKQPVSVKEKYASRTKDNPLIMVGMGASAGGLESFKEFFSAAPDTMNMAFIIVQHLDPTHESLMVQLLKKHTKMQVEEVEDNTLVESNHVYVIPPNKDMAVFNSILYIMEPSHARGFRKPIDFFFKSLAEDQREKAVGIIFSGTGSEGTLGLKDIKGHGGLSIVQDPESAKYDGMPRSAVNAGAEDYILPIHQMPEALLEYSKNRNFRPKEQPAVAAKSNELIEKIFILLRNQTGCNFGDYKSSTVMRRIEKRMALTQIGKLENYFKYLQKNKKEIRKLFNELLIGVTSFFRDKEAYRVLENSIVPQIIKNKSDGQVVRVWVAGCSTGEEAYSLAMLFDETINEQSKSLKLQIFASDIDERAINKARRGIYPETIVTDVSPKRLNRYFYKEDDTYLIKKEIRDKVIFSEHNFIKDPPFSKQDLVSCRNLLIYLNVETQKNVLGIFHYSLIPEGILFLGSSESIGEYVSLFEVMDRKHKLYKRKKVKQNRKPDIGHLFMETANLKPLPSSLSPKHKHMGNFSKITTEMLLDLYAPACAIINSNGEATYFSGNTGKYLQPSPGEAKLNVIDMARKGLKTDLRAIITNIRKSKKTENRSNVKVKTNGKFQVIDLCLRPLENFIFDEQHYLLTFEDKNIEAKANDSTQLKVDHDTTELQALEQELITSKEYLRSTIEQLEVSNEELKSSNEELQSSNEELQSTNEELETSKEELQSVNEEIVSVNSELEEKIIELANAYDDMNNLLASTKIGTIFLDNDLRIKRFTPSMSKIINLIGSDVGRPILDLTSNLIYDGFAKDAKKVLEILKPFQSAVKSIDGIWYQMKINPYRTADNVIEGVVVTFVNVTEEKELVEELNTIKNDYEHLLHQTQTTVYTQDNDLKYTGGIYKGIDFQSHQLIGKTDSDFYSKEDVQKLEDVKRTVLKTGKPFRKLLSLSIEGKTQRHDFTIKPILTNSKITGIACVSTDISEFAWSKDN